MTDGETVATAKIITAQLEPEKVQEPQEESYLDSRAIRAMFHMSSNVLWNRRHKGQFPDPDLAIGRGVHLWKKSTIENWVASNQFKSREAQG